MTEQEQFVADMVEAIGEAQATNRQREIGKAWLRYMIAHANRKAAQRGKMESK